MDLPLKPTTLVTRDLVIAFVQLVEQVKLSPGQPGASRIMAHLAELREEGLRALQDSQPGDQTEEEEK